MAYPKEVLNQIRDKSSIADLATELTDLKPSGANLVGLSPFQTEKTPSFYIYDGSKKLKSVNIPALVTCGRYDEGTPESSEYYASILPSSSLSIIEDSAHFPHVEKKEEYLEVLNTFLNDCDLGQELKAKPYMAFALLLAVAFSFLVLMYLFIN